jgi:hypothetical protein
MKFDLEIHHNHFLTVLIKHVIRRSMYYGLVKSLQFKSKFTTSFKNISFIKYLVLKIKYRSE